MAARTPSQAILFDALLDEFKRLGYSGALLELDYRYRAYLDLGRPERAIQAALFGRTPVAYDTALIGIALSNGDFGTSLANSHRSLGAPVILEVGEAKIGRWTVGATEGNTRHEGDLELPGFISWLRDNSAALAPTEFLRTKNIRKGPIFLQGRLFAGLIPELEDSIGDSLDPLLEMAFKAGGAAYEKSTGNVAPEDRLFKLAFWILAGKVFADRRHKDFANLSAGSDPDDVLSRIGRHYNDSNTRLLNRITRQEVFDRVWTKMDFRNLSVEVLAQIWSRTLVTPETRKRLGIHRTRRSIVEHIIDRIPFGSIDLDGLQVLEPCSGSATFLLGAMDRIRDFLPSLSQHKRHAFFQKRLSGFERDPFGAEISRLCLALADYPNPNGWRIAPEDVMLSKSFEQSLAKASVVLCNPPFEDLSPADVKKYGVATTHAPAAILDRVLDHLHPAGVLGFVLPRAFLDRRSYAAVRRRLTERFGDLDILALPDKGWDYADQETALVVATNPAAHRSAMVSYGIVREKQWEAFDLYHDILDRSKVAKTTDDAGTSLAIPELGSVWEQTAHCRTIGDIAEVHKGLEWKNLTANWDDIVADHRFQESRLGIRPRPKDFWGYECPKTAWLSVARERLRRPNALNYRWDAAKIIINKTAKGRGPWRISAFADTHGLYCGETFLVIWPKNASDLVPLTAILNSPIGNAFATVHEGKREIAIETIKDIPVPRLSEKQKSQIAELVKTYKSALANDGNSIDIECAKADRILREIDATVLTAYKLPPRAERKLLDFFNGDERKVRCKFADYFPSTFKPAFSLADWLTGRHEKATVKRFREQSRDLPAHIARALQNTE